MIHQGTVLELFGQPRGEPVTAVALQGEGLAIAPQILAIEDARLLADRGGGGAQGDRARALGGLNRGCKVPSAAGSFGPSSAAEAVAREAWVLVGISPPGERSKARPETAREATHRTGTPT